MKKTVVAAAFALLATPLVHAADYVIDTKGAHASINFKVKHLGVSWLTGRFNNFEGEFTWDAADPSASVVEVAIETKSVDSNHAERDKHLRSDDFLNASAHPVATFKSTKVEDLGNGELNIHGDFTLNGVTKPLVISTTKIGEAEVRGYRAGFEGTTSFGMGDFNFKKDYGQVEIELHVEGIRK